ncbi:MAG: hypothetical protein P8168_12165 [Deltaproteobacteria bacterium]|jgi:hypothetical protein
MTPGEPEIFAQEALALLLDKYPEAAAKLQVLIQENPSFQSLCEDYQDCLKALTYWQQDTAPEAREVCKSYIELQAELEQEIQQYLESEPAADCRGKGA